jgi:hypothetical protein
LPQAHCSGLTPDFSGSPHSSKCTCVNSQHETSRRYSEFDDLRKKLIKLVGPDIKTLAFPVRAAHCALKLLSPLW